LWVRPVNDHDCLGEQFCFRLYYGHSAEHHFAECRSSECCGASFRFYLPKMHLNYVRSAKHQITLSRVLSFRSVHVFILDKFNVTPVAKCHHRSQQNANRELMEHY
jgi:hypothetical protein